jgi:hypothetical protein
MGENSYGSGDWKHCCICRHEWDAIFAKNNAKAGGKQLDLGVSSVEFHQIHLSTEQELARIEENIIKLRRKESVLGLGHSHIWFCPICGLIIQAFEGDDSRIKLLVGIMENRDAASVPQGQLEKMEDIWTTLLGFGDNEFLQ